jgi:hypothetical protein
MKRLFVILASSVLFFACSNNRSNGEITTDIVSNPATAEGIDKNAKTPVIKFKNTDFNFGVVIAGEKVTHTYKFKNVGTKDLLLVKVKPS